MFATHARPDLLALSIRSLSRVDLYRPIHKALRANMADVLLLLGALDVNDPVALDHTLGRTARLLDHLAAHVAHENAFLHPAIADADQGAALATERDHDDHARGIAALRDRVQALHHAAPAARAALALCLYREFAVFMAENLLHMQTEEDENNAALWARHDDPALHALHARLLAHVAPELLAELLPWMVRALDPQELAEVYAGMQATAPAAALHSALQLARAELADARYTALLRALHRPAPALAA